MNQLGADPSNLAEVAKHPWPLPILNPVGEYVGAVSKNLFLRTLHRNQQDEQSSMQNGAS
jgi:glycine betaine/proline transport system ATP-binding protein